MPPTPTWGWSNTNLPIVNVSWNLASAYASWAGKRLPTEAEYEYVMRSGVANQLYPWGNGISSANANYARNVGLPNVSPTYSANAYGVYDIAGNVWEWCNDWYGFPLTGPVTDPQGAASGSYKVIRGGSWASAAISLQCALRYSIEPSVGYCDIGFRCASSTGGGGDGAIAGGGTIATGDSNSNGIPDWWEQWYFGLGGSGGDGSGTKFDSEGDPDIDGFSNKEEYIAGTDPTNPESALKMKHVKQEGSAMAIKWSSASGKRYTVQRSADLIKGFTAVATNVAATPPLNTYNDDSPDNGPYFYRVIVEQ
jgi:hypothetical protein